MRNLFSTPSSKGVCGKYYNFDLTARYFRKLLAHKSFYHVVSDKTANDLDMDSVFERIDRTTSCVGQQYLYAKLRTIGKQDELAKFSCLADDFQYDRTLRNKCVKQLYKLRNENGYYFEELFHGTHLKPKGFPLLCILGCAFLLFLVLTFFYPVFAFCLLPIFVTNIIFHYKNKANLNYYLTGVSEFSKCISVAKELSKEERLKAYFTDRDFLGKVAKIHRKTQYISFEKQLNNDLLAGLFVIVEWIKIAFNIETILFYTFIDDIIKQKDHIHKLFCFIGEVDSAVSVATLREETEGLCKPEFVQEKVIEVSNIVHPLVEDCVPNSLSLKNKSMLLTGSNMSGKTTFIRTIAINAILGQTICTCFAEQYVAPYLKMYSSIRIADSLLDSKSYFLEEVSTIREFIVAAQKEEYCLFILDEIFKGTNTTERIAAGKGILSYLNTAQHFVFVSTHDIELTELLEKDSYELYHFCEHIENNQLAFDYKLHEGKLRTKNAIKILELYSYPQEIIADALQTQKRLLAQV